MKIVILEPLGVQEETLKKLAKPLTDNGHEIIMSESKTDHKNADILVIANSPLKGDVIKSDKSLKMISVAFTGVDHVDLNACRENNIRVCNAAGYSTHAVAELTYGLILSVYRNIIPLNSTARNAGTKAGFSQREIFGKTIGIVGTGAIGMRVAELAKVFGCNVIAYSRTKKAEAEKLGIKYVSLDELMSTSDIVSVHVPLNDSTRGLINKDRIALMKKTAILINTARGPIVDYTALGEALKEGRIQGAGLDVFEVEPPLPKDNPLFDAPNLVVTPHIGFATEEAMITRAEITIENIKKWLDGNPQNVIL